MANKLSLAEVIGRSVSKIDTQKRERIEYIDLDQLREDPRNFYSLDGLDELAANIELVGLQQPLRVRQLNPGAGAPGGYEIVSGHRRRAALRRLADEGKSKYLSVPCIVERDECSDAMRELRLIYANADTRRMTDAELSRQIERVHALLLQLRDEGVELPGRLRDHVAEAMHISRTKVGTLQATRKRLIPELAEAWDKGEINTAKAARLAKENADVQGHLVDTAFETVRDGTEADVDRMCRERMEETREPDHKCTTGWNPNNFCGAASYCSKHLKCCAACDDHCNSFCGWIPDQPKRDDEPRPQWRTGTPLWAGLYYATLEYEKTDVGERVLRWDGKYWAHKDGEELWEGYKVPQWYPLPEG